MKAATDWFQWFRFGERRKAERLADPRLVAFYWDGDKPKGHVARDISAAGLYLLTEDRWYPRTLVRLTLQATVDGKPAPEQSITVQTMVVRMGEDGVGLAFIPEDAHPAGFSNGADKRTLEDFLKHLSVPEDATPKRSKLSIVR